MLYQELLLGDHPYSISLINPGVFCAHRHPELEISYCLSGFYSFAINKQPYRLNPGDFIIVNPMLSHEVLGSGGETPLLLNLKVGSSFLMEHFDLLAKATFTEYFVKDSHAGLTQMFDEITELKRHPTDFSEISAKGTLYKVCAYILENCVDQKASAQGSRALQRVVNIERALQHIYVNYPQTVTIDEMASITGYSKSNFCRIFKSVTGETFHSVLNRIRVQSACTLLRDTDASIEKIAFQVGFADGKALCRVFRQITGSSPGTYRRSHT